jgi:NADH dehydrogenase
MCDVLITREEIRGLMAELLHVTTPPTGRTALTTWMKANAATLGRRYASELDRRRDRQRPYLANET